MSAALPPTIRTTPTTGKRRDSAHPYREGTHPASVHNQSWRLGSQSTATYLLGTLSFVQLRPELATEAHSQHADVPGALRSVKGCHCPADPSRSGMHHRDHEPSKGLGHLGGPFHGVVEVAAGMRPRRTSRCSSTCSRNFTFTRGTRRPLPSRSPTGSGSRAPRRKARDTHFVWDSTAAMPQPSYPYFREP